MLDANVILIGPLGAGKTTVGRLLGAALGVLSLELDDLRWRYYAEIGYDPEHAEQLRREGGLLARSAYWKPFEVHGVERLLADYPSGYVLPLGGGNTVYDDPAHFERVRQALAPYLYVVLLLPSPDADQSLRILGERLRALMPDCAPNDMQHMDAINRHFIADPSNYHLAKYTVYTADKSPAETCADILAALNLRAK